MPKLQIPDQHESYQISTFWGTVRVSYYGMRTALVVLAWMLWVGMGFAQQVVSDAMRGRNTVGPYSLTWKQIETRSEIVLRGERWLTRERDYWLNESEGQIRFATPVRPDEIVRVSYRINPNRAQRNTTPDVPLQTELARRGPMALSLQARLWEQSNQPQLDVGLRATWDEPNRQGEAVYLLRNPDDDAPALLMWRSRYQTADGLRAHFNFSSVDTTFGDAKPYGLTAGQQQAEAGVVWTPDRFLTARFQWSQRTPLQNPTAEQQNWVAGVDYNLANARLTAERQIVDAGNQPAQMTDRLAMMFQPSTQLRVSVEDRSQTIGERTVGQTTVQTQIGQAVQLSHRQTNAPDSRTDESQVGFRVNAGTTQANLALGQRWHEEQTERTAQLGLQSQLNPALRLGGELSVNDQQGQMLGYQMSVRPSTDLDLSLYQRTYRGFGGYHLQSQHMEWRWRTSPNLQLSGQISQNPLDKGRPQPVERQQYQLRWQSGAWQAEVGYTEQDLLSQALTERRYTLSLQNRLDAYTLLGLTFQQSEWERDQFLREASLRLGLTRQKNLFYFSLEAQAHLPRTDLQAETRPRYSGSVRLGIQF